MDFPLRDQYCSTWRSILSLVASWDSSRIDDWIAGMSSEMESEDSLIFHELPSTWAAWALFPLNDPLAAESCKKARNTFCRFVHSLHNGHELQRRVDWSKVRPVYEQLRMEIEAALAAQDL
jgi:hypothetical protein